MMKKLYPLLVCALFSCAAVAAEQVDAEQININSADQETLSKTIKGVGEKRAAAILRYREEHGPFKSLDELLQVPGINASILEKNRKRLAIE